MDTQRGLRPFPNPIVGGYLSIEGIIKYHFMVID